MSQPDIRLHLLLPQGSLSCVSVVTQTPVVSRVLISLLEPFFKCKIYTSQVVILFGFTVIWGGGEKGGEGAEECLGFGHGPLW